MLNIESKKGNLKQIEVENTYLFLFYLLSLYFCMKSNVKEYGVSKHLWHVVRRWYKISILKLASESQFGKHDNKYFSGEQY